VAVDGKGRVIIGSKIDEFGLMIFQGNFNEFGNFAKAQRLFHVILTEILTITHVKHTTFKRYVDEPIQITVSSVRALYKSLTETLTITTSKSLQVTRTIATSILLSIARHTELNRTYQQIVHITPNYYKRFYIVMSLEILHLTQTVSPIKAIITRQVPVIISTVRTLSFKRNISEPVTISISRYVKRHFDTTIHIIDAKRHTTVRRIMNTTVTITAIYEAAIPYIMRYFSTKVREVDKAVNIYQNIKSSFVNRIRQSEVRRVKTQSQIYPVHKNSNVALDDGRDVK
jgi:hypothetical protein